MSRKESRESKEQSPQKATVSGRHVPADRKLRTDENVPKHRQCPKCWGEHKGVGNVRQSNPIQLIGGGQRNKRYYYCDTCTHSWVVVVQPAIIHQSVDDLSTRV